MHNTDVPTSKHCLSLMLDFWEKLVKKNEKQCTNPVTTYLISLDQYLVFHRTPKYNFLLLGV